MLPCFSHLISLNGKIIDVKSLQPLMNLFDLLYKTFQVLLINNRQEWCSYLALVFFIKVPVKHVC